MKSYGIIRTFVLILSLLAISQAAKGALNGPLYQECVAKADSLQRLEQWEDAEKFLRQALRAEPANPSNQMLLVNMGMILTSREQYGDALRHLDAALTLNPRSFLALKQRGITHSAMRDYEAACADFTQALDVDSADTDVRCLRASVLACTGKLKEAARDYSAVLEMRPHFTEALEGIAWCLCSDGRQGEALPYLTRLVEARPDPESYFSRGLAYAMLGRLTEASADVAEGLKADPSDGNLWLLRAYIEKTSYRNNDASSSLAKALRNGADPDIRRRLLPDM